MTKSYKYKVINNQPEGYGYSWEVYECEGVGEWKLIEQAGAAGSERMAAAWAKESIIQNLRTVNWKSITLSHPLKS